MDRIENIERYLRVHIAEQSESAPVPVQRRGRPFVTISRESGTGAHALAETMVDTFGRLPDSDIFQGWKIYDRSVCEIVATDARYASSLDSLLEEEYRAKTNDFFHQVLRATVDQDIVMERVFLVVRTIAGMGRAVIVGRGGSHVTKGMGQGVSLRLVAPEAQRIARAMEIHNMTERAARADIHRRDADRGRMMKARFGVDISDPAEYDMTWNTGAASYAEISNAVAVLVRGRTSATGSTAVQQ